mgnify:CR=1 FL=1
MSLNIPACFNGSTPNSDVWFSFTVPADGSVVDFQIDLSGVDGPNGSITQPQMAVYRGDCMLDGLDELLCVTSLAGEVKSADCDILFNTSAITLCRFEPMVVLSQTMISYEPGIAQYYGYGLARFRLLVIHLLQNIALRRANGVIFLSLYAGKIIEKSCPYFG